MQNVDDPKVGNKVKILSGVYKEETGRIIQIFGQAQKNKYNILLDDRERRYRYWDGQKEPAKINLALSRDEFEILGTIKRKRKIKKENKLIVWLRSKK